MRAVPEIDRSSALIAPLRRGHVRAVGEVFAASHAEYPSFRHLVPEPAARAAVLRALLADVARDALPFGAASVALVDSEVLGAALWLPPGRFPWSPARKARAVPAFLAVLRAAPRSFLPLMRFGANAERRHPREPHWYLQALGVKPTAQGLGLGTRLLEPVLARADREGLPCYLETARQENVGFYERLGFRVEHEALPLVPGGPTHWALRRPPVVP